VVEVVNSVREELRDVDYPERGMVYVGVTGGIPSISRVKNERFILYVIECSI
jgi:hypothetical protein